MDYISCGIDFIEFIHSEDDVDKFMKMKALEKYFHLPANECIHQVIEYIQLERELKGEPPLKVIHQDVKNN